MTDAIRAGGLYQDELGQWKDANGNPAKPPTKSETGAATKEAQQAERDFQADVEKLGEHEAALTWTQAAPAVTEPATPQPTAAHDQPVTSLAPAAPEPQPETLADAPKGVSADNPPTPDEAQEFAPDAPTKKGKK